MRRLLLTALLLLAACRPNPQARVTVYLADVDKNGLTPWAEGYLRSLRDPRITAGAEPLPAALIEHLKSMGVDSRTGDTLGSLTGRASGALSQLSTPLPAGPKWGKPEALALLAAPTPSTVYGRIVRVSMLAKLTATDKGPAVVPSELAVAPFIEALSDPDSAVVAMGVAQAVGHPAASDHGVQLALLDAMEKTPLLLVHYVAAQALKEATGQWFPVRPDAVQQDVAKWREYLTAASPPAAP